MLLIHGWKNSTSNTKNVVIMIQNNHGHVTFLNPLISLKKVGQGKKWFEIVNKSKQIARTKYCTEIYAVVSDNTSNMLKMRCLSNELVYRVDIGPC